MTNSEWVEYLFKFQEAWVENKPLMLTPDEVDDVFQKLSKLWEYEDRERGF